MNISEAEANATRSSYMYTPLAKDRPQIRLLRLLPKDPQDRNDALEVSLETFDLVAAPAYTALSYEWGSTSNQASILVDKSCFTIRRNLHDFLEDYIASADAPGYLWIDQVSINQACVDERNQQVMLMSIIYEGAETVLAWLSQAPSAGPCLESIEQVNELKGSWRSTMYDLFSGNAKPHVPNPVLAQYVKHVHELCGKSYWSRHWVAQELAAAKICLVMYGRYTLSMWSIMSLLWLFGPNSPSLVHLPFRNLMELLHNMKGPVDGRHIHEENCIRWVTAARFGCSSCCEDLRDKVYGIQNILPQQYRIPVNYNLPVEEMFTQAASGYLVDSALSFSEGHWVPDGIFSLSTAMGLKPRNADVRHYWLKQRYFNLSAWTKVAGKGKEVVFLNRSFDNVSQAAEYLSCLIIGEYLGRHDGDKLTEIMVRLLGTESQTVTPKWILEGGYEGNF